MSFVVLIQPAPDRVGFEVRGPYRSFKTASADAKAWDGIDGREATVEPLRTKDGLHKAHRSLLAALNPCGK